MKEFNNLLSIIIPSYNHSEYIETCISECLKIPNCAEIIVIDDGSTDESKQLINRLEQKNSKIKTIFKQNSGLVDSLNMGLKIASSEYIYICASDDIPIPEVFEKAMLSMKDQPECNFKIFGGLNFFPHIGSTSPIYSKNHEKFLLAISKTDDIDKLLYFEYPHPILIQSTIYKKSALIEIGGWDKDIKLDDYAIFIKLFKHSAESAAPISYDLETNLVLYRHHENNSYKKLPIMLNYNLQVINKYCPERLKTDATAKAIAKYFLISLKTLDFKGTIGVLSKVTARNFPSVFIESISFIYSKLFK